MICKEKASCRLCHSDRLDKVLELTPTPLANNFVEVPTEQDVYPLDLMKCSDCQHVQLGVVIDPDVLYSNYLYSTATAASIKDHPVVQSFEEYAWSVFHSFEPHSVLDIGCNDGTLLRAFKSRGCEVLGVDPAGLCPDDIPHVDAYFTEELAGRLGKFDVVTANNVLAHVDDLDDVIRGVKLCLAADGVFIMQVSYLLDVIDTCAFDTIYHEHLDYHTVGPLVKFFASHGMTVFEVVRTHLYGGSIRLYVKDGIHRPGPSVEWPELCERGMDKMSTYVEFQRAIDLSGYRLFHELEDKAHVVGFGAPAKLTTRMYQYRMTGDDVDFIVDDTPAKQGRFTPGTNLEIKPTSQIGNPDAVILFAWNCAEAIKANYNGHNYLMPW